MNSEAVNYYRQHPRVFEALLVSDSIPKSSRVDSIALNSLIQSKELRELEERIESFNLFSALGVTEKEIRHSRLLARLLDPGEAHGEGIAYLKRFLHLVCAEDGDDLSEYNLDLWEFEVSCESDQIDILLENYTDKFVCVIENKIRIDQHSGQLEKYRNKIEKKHSDWDQKFVFLSLKAEIPEDPSYLPNGRKNFHYQPIFVTYPND